AHAPESRYLRSSLSPPRGSLTVLLIATACALSASEVRAQMPAPATAAAPAPAAAPAAQSSQPTQLDAYLGNLKTLRASFLQTLADGQGHEIDRATGKIIVQRPGKFSWEIHPQTASGTDGAKAGGGAAAGTGASSGQLMVCDGRNLWFFDRDLGQVTVKPVDDALSATPAMLLSGAVDVRRNFTITPAGERMGLSWVLVEPHGAEADFREALFGFDKGELKRMILEDKLDQTATVIFDKIERNTRVSAAEVSFTPPPGVDVIGTPRK
ncbi:MAG TPA: outer membrane lipoprotein carrier protein LolA, partial [Steroidobacteraceae bacterium]|nr:outer membrane lipoprotein carrier protein LolA [Steroidobacteraceae bacterium]